VEVVASLSQGRTAAAQCGLFTHISVPVIFEPPCRIVPIASAFLRPMWVSFRRPLDVNNNHFDEYS